MRLRHFDLNLLLALDALLDTHSVTRAAERMNLSQSAVSSALGRLREHFGDQLLVHVGRRMELTPLALGLTRPVREALDRVQAAVMPQAQFDLAVTNRCFIINAKDNLTTVLLTQLMILLLPTISTPQPISKLDVHETMHTSPDNRVARWGIIGACKITAELRELDEIA